VNGKPLKISQGKVISDWIDYNGHMSEGFYGLVFGDASDEYLIRIGFNADYRGQTKCAFYTVETHISFLDELSLGTEFEIETTVVGADAIRLHLLHELKRPHDGVVAATQETLMLHVDTSQHQVSPMTDALLRAASTDVESHGQHVDHDQIGKAIKGPEKLSG
jgi:acyl-CoA thioesterase FadM